MQKCTLFFLTIFLILPLLFVLSPESKAQVLEEKMVVIKGTDDWKNTRIRLYPKDKVTIRAAGQVCFSTEYPNVAIVDADGWNRQTFCDDWPGQCLHCDDPIMTVNHAALIGNVGSDDFFIGKNSNFSGKDGFLYLRINDCTLTENFPNSGQFEVFISVKHIK